MNIIVMIIIIIMIIIDLRLRSSIMITKYCSLYLDLYLLQSRLADPTGEPVNASVQDPVAEIDKDLMKEPIDEPPEETTREVFDERMKEKTQEPMDSMKAQRETCNQGVDVEACAYSTTSLDDSFQK